MKEKQTDKAFVLDPTVGDLLALKGRLERLRNECERESKSSGNLQAVDASYCLTRILLAIDSYERFLRRVKQEGEEGE